MFIFLLLQLNSSNISRLGNVLQREGGIHDPLECLVEIGLEKLKKEMLLIFSKAQIAAGYNLNVPHLPKYLFIKYAMNLCSDVICYITSPMLKWSIC